MRASTPFGRAIALVWAGFAVLTIADAEGLGPEEYKSKLIC
jgi:hypothetical protein